MEKKRFYHRNKLVHTHTKSLHVCTLSNENLELSLEAIPMFSCKMKHQDISGFQHAAQNNYAQRFNMQNKYQGTYMKKTIALYKLTCRKFCKTPIYIYTYKSSTNEDKTLIF